MILPSRRNLVRTVPHGNGLAVRKLFDAPEDWRAELDLLQRLSGRMDAPRLLASAPGIILMEYAPFPTLLDELERQEREGFAPAPWKALRRWLAQMRDLTGRLPGDGNLRNFLWDVRQSRIIGVDYEDYRAARLDEALAQIAAFVLEYAPQDTPLKRQAARMLFDGEPEAQRLALRQRRANRRTDAAPFSFIVLAGGRSSRMGRDKAMLRLCGSSLLELQLDKARLLGSDDILISGAREAQGAARAVPDAYPDRGPLGGLHACLREARHPICAVLSVDAPLIPPCLLRDLVRAHAQGSASITMAVHGDRWEPLIGVYDRALHAQIEPLIREHGAPVRALTESCPCQRWPSQLPEPFWTNCNTPEAYQSLLNG